MADIQKAAAQAADFFLNAGMPVKKVTAFTVRISVAIFHKNSRHIRMLYSNICLELFFVTGMRLTCRWDCQGQKTFLRILS